MGEDPTTLAELAVYARPRALQWEPVPAAVPRPPTARERAIIDGVRALGVLSGPQIARRFMAGASGRSVRGQLRAIVAQGRLRRAHLLCEGPGQTPRLFFADGGAGDARSVVRALHVNAWWLAFERIAGGVLGERRLGADLTFTVDGQRLLLEFVCTPRPDEIAARLARYAATDETVVFVLRDEPTAIAVARFAARLVRGRFFFASERDVHLGRLRALTLSGGDQPVLGHLLNAGPSSAGT